MSDHIREFQGATAPPSMVSDSSGTRVDSSTSLTMPVPPQRRQAPRLLKERSSAAGAQNFAPHSGQTDSMPSAQASDGGT